MSTGKTTTRSKYNEGTAEQKKTKSSLGRAAAALQSESGKRERTFGKTDSFRFKRKYETQAERDKFISDNFLPGDADYLRNEFGIDLHDMKAVGYYSLRDIQKGLTTNDALFFTVVPFANGHSFNPVDVFASIQVIWPFENGKRVPISVENNVLPFVKTFPFREMVLDGNDDVENEEKGVLENVNFSKAQLNALKGIGIDDNVLLGLPQSVKKDIVEGREFSCAGTVMTAHGHFVNLAGPGQLETSADGKIAIAKVRYNTKSVLDNNLVLDISSVRTVGNIRLDFFERDPNGNPIYEKDENGKVKEPKKPKLNQQAIDLNDYGYSFNPVKGVRYGRDGKISDVYCDVSVVNGGLYIAQRRKIVEKNPIDGKESEALEPAVSHVSVREGKRGVFYGNNHVPFVSAADEAGYRSGKGGRVETKDGVLYAVPDPSRAGFAKVFDKEKSANLIERFKMKTPAPRRSAFSWKR